MSEYVQNEQMLRKVFLNLKIIFEISFILFPISDGSNPTPKILSLLTEII